MTVIQKTLFLAAGKTAKSILISCGARLAPFDIPQLREIMSYDELELDRMGDRRTATFFCISDTDSTYNFLVALAFSQMFNLLCERADNVHGGRLPHHVRVLWDEAANTGQVPNLEKLVAVIRSREISLCLLYQQLAQCKAIYDKNAETILGNMDSVLFLGGREVSTIKEISENWLGKATISMQTEGRSRGQSESYSQNTLHNQCRHPFLPYQRDKQSASHKKDVYKNYADHNHFNVAALHMLKAKILHRLNIITPHLSVRRSIHMAKITKNPQTSKPAERKRIKRSFLYYFHTSNCCYHVVYTSNNQQIMTRNQF